MKSLIGMLIIAGAAMVMAAPSFVSEPALTKDGSNRLWIDFTMNESTDVAVSIVDARDSTIVRHLIAGILGSKAPAPLLPNTLVQHFEWDGEDDLGFLVPNPEIMKVRVRAGIGVSFDKYAGSNPYSFSRGYSAYGGGIFGFALGRDGTVFVCGNPGVINQEHMINSVKYIRQYDRNGDYLKTVYPYPSTLTMDEVKGWKPVVYPDANSYTPVHGDNSLPSYSKSLFDVLREHPNATRLQMVEADGRLLFAGMRYRVNLETTGGKTDTVLRDFFITTPAMPSPSGATPIAGSPIMMRFPNSNDYLVSGIYTYASTGASTTDFYRDGQVFRVNPATKTASVWLSLDTVVALTAGRNTALQGPMTVSELMGITADSKSRIYVCDRLNRRIGVYDTTAALLGQIPVGAPERVQVSSKTGEIFVLSRYYNTTGGAGHVRLIKFASFDAGAAPVCSVTVSGADPLQYRFESHLLLNDSASPATLWTGMRFGTVKVYRDNGTALSLVRDFGAGADNTVSGFDRLAVDRKSETIYFNDNWVGLYKITDWNNPVVRVCSTSANKRIYGKDCAVSPFGMLYVRECRTATDWYGSISRYTLASRHAPVNWTATGRNRMTPYSDNKFGASVAERGLAVGPDGLVANFQRDAVGNYGIYFLSDTVTTDSLLGKLKVRISTVQNGGVKFDRAGNLYFATKINNPTLEVPAAFASDPAFTSAVGSIVRLPAGFDSAAVSAAGVGGSASRMYPFASGSFSKEIGGSCICRSPRFDLDPYGRLFISNAFTNQVTVADNEGNLLLRFGKYGNLDAPASGTVIPLAWPTAAAASEDFIYVADFGNSRIARVRMTYALDNRPEIKGSTVSEVNARSLAPVMRVQPNPFTAGTRVTLLLTEKSRVRLDVFSATGRLVTTLASDLLNAGAHQVQWNGRDRAGRAVAAGVYYLRLSAGTREGFESVILAR